MRLLFTGVYVGDTSLKLQLDFDTTPRFQNWWVVNLDVQVENEWCIKMWLYWGYVHESMDLYVASLLDHV